MHRQPTETPSRGKHIGLGVAVVIAAVLVSIVYVELRFRQCKLCRDDATIIINGSLEAQLQQEKKRAIDLTLENAVLAIKLVLTEQQLAEARRKQHAPLHHSHADAEHITTAAPHHYHHLHQLQHRDRVENADEANT